MATPMRPSIGRHGSPFADPPASHWARGGRWIGGAGLKTIDAREILTDYGSRLLRARDGHGMYRITRTAHEALMATGVEDAMSRQMLGAQRAVVRAIRECVRRAGRAWP